MTASRRVLLGSVALVVAALAGRSAISGVGARTGGDARAPEARGEPAEVRPADGAGQTVAGAAGVGDSRTADASAAAVSLPLPAAIDRIRSCRPGTNASGAECAAVVYFWSPRMPLSAAGVAEIGRAAASSGAELLVVRAEELEAQAREPWSEAAAGMLAAGATLHYPSLLLYRNGGLAGQAILGFKRADGYRALLAERLESAPDSPDLPAPPAFADDTLRLSVEFAAQGRPGAYFRAVPGHQTLVYEASGTIHLLDLSDRSSTTGPGTIDFIPSPDGRIFVTPGGNGRGLEFYDAAEVFAAARRGEGQRVRPVFVDVTLRDQYPSVGVLRSATEDGGTTVYRVLTSWFDGIVFRDYEVRAARPGERLRVRPIGARSAACRRVSIPILSPDGGELAGRDETTGTTRIYRLGDGEACDEMVDLRLPTGKVAWSPDGRRLAFAIPGGALRDGSGTVAGGGRAMAGIIVYDRDRGTHRRLPGSEDAHRLSFPEFVGADSLVFLIAPPGRGRPSVFRLVCCVN